MTSAQSVSASLLILDALKRQQLQWAMRTGIAPDDAGYCPHLDDNLFQPLSPATRLELRAGDGGELGQEGTRGKAQALHSSAALACNFFDYWRGRDLAPLAKAFGTGQLTSLAFEQKFPTGLPGNSPNLDVVLREASGRVHAIESKFTEPFYGRKQGPAFRPGYFAGPRRWDERGLPGCQQLAERLRSEPLDFELLDVPQLLKHMLGLATQEKDWRVWLLWFDPGGEAGDLMECEIERFIEVVGSDAARFDSLTYQKLFARLSAIPGVEEAAWREYLRSRYFSS